MSIVSNEITNLQNQTSVSKLAESKLTSKTGDTKSKNDSNMFLTLMLEQLQHQDPTQPTDNTEWLSQLAQYSSLEQMAQMNNGFSKCMEYMEAMQNDMSINSEITQTLSLIGKDVTIQDPEDETGATKITGKVAEASFEDGTGKIKVNGNYYPITYILKVTDTSIQQ